MFVSQKELKTLCIGNRRYLGNKFKLLPFIKHIVQTECEDIQSFADIFAGTGAVASAFSDKQLITNDILFSNYICHIAWFGKDKYRPEIIVDNISRYNALVIDEQNYMTENFSDTFFNRSNCSKIGYIREDIELLYHKRKINKREHAILIAALLYGMDKIAHTCGHYDAFIKNNMSNKKLELYNLEASNINCAENVSYNVDANILVKNFVADLVYIDPPYNSRQYCDAYHVLENVARWEKPEVFGIAKKMNRSKLKSVYCTQKANAAFEELIGNIKAKYILLSYNNMANKGNSRSNAKISDEDIISTLESKGTLKIFSENHKAFTAGKSHIQENEERLFLCICSDNQRS